MDAQPPSGADREVLILNLDVFAKKNVTQIHALEAEGYAFTIASNDLRSDSRAIFDREGFARSRLILMSGLFGRLATSWKLLRAKRYNHVEFYVVGHLAIPYLLMVKLLRQRMAVVERGDIGIYSHYNPVLRAGMRLAYKLADLIIYKEVYMAEPLKRFTSAPLVMVPNCVAERPVNRERARTLDFLWVNRTIPQRRPEWAAAAMRDPRLSDRRLVMLGMETRASLEPHIAVRQERLLAVVGPNITLEGFVDPEAYYPAARFFCLPSSIVFGNNSLLEAMASGVVPVVTEAPGVERIVEDGVNGIVTAFDEGSYREGMARAAALSEEEWLAMSRNAVETVRQKYSVEAWTRSMADVYARVKAA
ncbi:MAG TPA: glycosyltransferase family 4 protein [Allosphingosinicella sp.]|jgi:glycosyltransferase involved in cell wall biosynthesis